MHGLDLLDQQIIVELRRDGRLTNTEIARRLGVSEATVRSRLHRLTSAGIIRVAAAVNLTRLGHNVHVIIGVKCDVDRIPHVMRGLADVREVRMVSAVSGRWDLLVTASFRSREDLLSFLTDCLGG
ncbi:MAG: Lrp/AsnC family transcriptional regulator, partial [Chloroflexota bacterium]